MLEKHNVLISSINCDDKAIIHQSIFFISGAKHKRQNQRLNIQIMASRQNPNGNPGGVVIEQRSPAANGLMRRAEE